MVYQVKKTLTFSYAHRLLKHQGKCMNYHGHNGVIEVLCENSSLDNRQMVVDFDEISEAVKDWIDTQFDHAMIIGPNDPIIPFLKKENQKHFITADEPTAEAMAKLVFDQAKIANLPIKSVTLWETPTSSATIRI